MADNLATIKDHWLWIEQNVVPELLQMEDGIINQTNNQGNTNDYSGQQIDYLTLKFECLAIEDDKTEKEEKEETKTKWEAQFLQYFGLMDEKLLERK